jgi:hypothetical protein
MARTARSTATRSPRRPLEDHEDANLDLAPLTTRTTASRTPDVPDLRTADRSAAVVAGGCLGIESAGRSRVKAAMDRSASGVDDGGGEVGGASIGGDQRKRWRSSPGPSITGICRIGRSVSVARRGCFLRSARAAENLGVTTPQMHFRKGLAETPLESSNKRHFPRCCAPRRAVPLSREPLCDLDRASLQAVRRSSEPHRRNRTQLLERALVAHLCPDRLSHLGFGHEVSGLHGWAIIAWNDPSIPPSEKPFDFLPDIAELPGKLRSALGG